MGHLLRDRLAIWGRTVNARRALGVAVGLLVAASCVPGPFERLNPYDPNASITGRLEVLTDTVSAYLEIAEVRLITEPAFDVDALPPTWVSDQSAILTPIEGGRFQLISTPTVPTSVTVRAIYPSFTATAVIVAGRP